MAAGTAVKISGRSPDARFSFINDVYEPMGVQHNGRQVFVSRDVSSRYLFHTGKDRWVISKMLDDGARCWAFVQAGNAEVPSDCQGPWTLCDGDGEWRADPKVKCVAVPPSTDKFVQLRLSLDADLQQYGMVEVTDLKKLWRRLDYNNNGVVSLAEIDKMVVEMVSGGSWPAWLNNKPALMRAYKKTVLKDCPGDEFVQKEEFHSLLLNIFWFAKLWQIFTAVDAGGDRRIDLREFMAGMNQLGLQLNPTEAQAEFKKMDSNGGGQVLFVEMCAYIRNRVNPDDNPQFDADVISGEHCEAASYSKVKKGAPTRGIASGSMSKMAPQATAPQGHEMARMGHQAALRSRGIGATLTHTVKLKSMADFADLEAKIKAMCADPQKIKDLWRKIDANGNNLLSLAEVDKWVVENYPLLNHKPALMRCYKMTIEMSQSHDQWIHVKDFKKLLVNLFYFNKIFWIFDEVDGGDDRRLTFQEFKMIFVLAGCTMSEVDAVRDFRSLDKNGAGMILFDEFCSYFASKACPQGMTDLVDDGVDRTAYNTTIAQTSSTAPSPPGTGRGPRPRW